jgi:glycosyltransferase involved in cell wall biosynthesis
MSIGAVPDRSNRTKRVAVVYGTLAGVGGLGHSAAAGIAAAAYSEAEKTFAFGPGAALPWSLPGGLPAVIWEKSPEVIPAWVTRYTWLRCRPGRASFLRDRRLGQWAAQQVARSRPSACYLFTQVALETLRWCRQEGAASVLDNPNGHIRNFKEVLEREARTWFGKKYHGHPTQEMVERVEEEYRLVDRIRVYSAWGKASMLEYGVPEDKVHILRQTVNLERFRPAAVHPPAEGPLRICYVGSLDLRKGFVYLLRAIRALGANRVKLRIVGATGDRDCAKLLARERAGLDVEATPGESLPVYQQSELLAIPTLEDGLPFVLVEGLACGLPVIVTDQAGAAECVRPGESGWVIPAGNAEALAAALEQACERRKDLGAMGEQARSDVERYAGQAQLEQLSDWFASNERMEHNA